MQTDWEGHYLDGRTATRHRVTLRLTHGGMHLRFEGGKTIWWSYDDVRLRPTFHSGDPVRLERGGDLPEIVQVSDPVFLSSLQGFAPGLRAAPGHAPLRFNWRSTALIVAAGIIAGAFVIYFWLIPSMASFLAPHVPVSWEEQLGGPVLDSLAPFDGRCSDEARNAPIVEIVGRLGRTIPDRQHAFRVIVVDNPVMNAFAVPGGTIVVFQGLLDKTRSPEELAGVLAHEMQHVVQRHIMKLFLEHASTGVVISAMTGDGGEALAFGLESAKTLGLLRYSRGHESEADAAGLAMLARAGIDPRGMIAFFETMSAEAGAGIPEMLSYLSTHPDTGSRTDDLRSHLPPPGDSFAPLLPGLDWEGARRVCAP